MKLRWPALAALTLLPFGAALADYADQSKPVAPLVQPERTVEHSSLIQSAEQSLSHATRTARELSIALENARRDQDMLLVTCLADAVETVKAAHAGAVVTLGLMNATANADQARGHVSRITRANQQLMSALQNAARCEGEEGDEDGDGTSVVVLDEASDPTIDPGGPAIDGPIGGPVALPPPTVDVMEPGTDIPMTPPTASPMR
jgi:hypothetical protein